MSDLISRQAAIDALDTGLWGVEWDKALATAMLKDLPSVQPPARKGGKSMIEVIPEKITVADQIRGMNDQELNGFLFRFKLNACGCFIKKRRRRTL